MSVSFSIPLEKMLEKALQIKEENPEESMEEIAKKVIPEFKIVLESPIPIQIKKKCPRRPREKKELDDEIQCNARTFNKKIHLNEDRTLKVNEEDPKNQYGGRCQFEKKDGTHFCSKHKIAQKYGVWNKHYDDELKKYMDKNKCLIESKETKIKKQSITISYELTQEQKKLLEEEDETPTIEGEDININGIEYTIDSNNIVWNDEGEKVGIYDIEKKILYQLK